MGEKEIDREKGGRERVIGREREEGGRGGRDWERKR